MTLRFGTDGVRGAALTELTPDYVTRLGRAAAGVLGGSRWLVGRDTRESGPVLAAAFTTGLASDLVIDLGVVPTPLVAYWSHRLRVPAAVVTASHNPWGDNGVKIFAAGGSKLPDDVELAIEAAMESDVPIVDPGAGAAAAPLDRDPVDDYLLELTRHVPSLAGLRVVLDCANGATSAVAPRAFREVGADVVVINDAPDGRNINDACGATAPQALAAAVLQHAAALGLAFDGDGDRVIAVDDRGAVVDGDRMLALAALQLRDAGQLTHDTVVVTVMSNLGFHRAMARAGIDVVTTAVGDRSVLEALDAGGYALGGEQSGHIIYRHLATTGDGVLAGLRLAQDVVTRRRSLADLADEAMTSYPQVLVNVRVADRHPHVATELAGEIAAAEAALDGEGRVLLRPSGTEPLIRVMVEASTPETASATADHLAGIVRARFA